MKLLGIDQHDSNNQITYICVFYFVEKPSFGMAKLSANKVFRTNKLSDKSLSKSLIVGKVSFLVYASPFCNSFSQILIAILYCIPTTHGKGAYYARTVIALLSPEGFLESQ